MNWKCQNQSRKKAEVDDENGDIRTLDNNLVGLAQSLGAGQIICLQSTLRSDYLSSLPGAEEFSGLGCRRDIHEKTVIAAAILMIKLFIWTVENPALKINICEDCSGAAPALNIHS